jgi:hypothetical protein
LGFDHGRIIYGKGSPLIIALFSVGVDL